MKRLILVTAALVAAVAVFVVFTIQPRRLTLSAPTDGTIAGVFHIHTNRSDGLSGADEIAAAAARVGLKFIVFTDHGDGTRRPDPPTYRSGVLCLDGVEISTTGGHYIAIDMAPAPYPLGGEGRDVVEDVRRLGGFGIVAHPDSPKPELRWRDWEAPFDAVEILNPDTSWRLWAQQAANSTVPRRARWYAARKLVAALVDYPIRPAETIAGLLNGPHEISARLAELATRRRIVTLAGLDAHARLAMRDESPAAGVVLPIPGYEPAFRVLSLRVKPERPLSGNAADDAGVVLRALRAGHAYTAIDAVATPPSFEFTASNAGGGAREGDELKPGGPVTLRVRTNAPSSFTTIVWDGIKVVSTDHHQSELSLTVSGKPAVYWVEVRSTGRTPQLPWIISNPIYVRGADPPTRLIVAPPRASQSLFDGKSADGWRVEHDATSVGAVELAPIIGGNELRFRWALSGQITPAPFVGLVADTPGGVAANDRLTFNIRTERPMRISVQLRAPRDGGEADRWQRSVYVAPTDEDRTIPFNELSPIGTTQTASPPLAAVRSVLFVVDPVNTRRESSGRIWIKRAALQR